MIQNFKDKVRESYKDLLNYSEKDVKLIAKQMKIKDCNDKTHDELCRQISKKVIYLNTPTEHFEKCERYTKNITDEKLKQIRDKIYNKFIDYKDSVGDMNVYHLKEIFEIYDDECFEGDMQKYIYNKKYVLEFRTSGEKTFTTEGICLTTCNYTITIPINYFSRVKGVVNVAGHMCKDQLECLIRVMEHELTHLIIFMLCDDNNIAEEHGRLFMDVLHKLFRHTDYRHYMF